MPFIAEATRVASYAVRAVALLHMVSMNWCEFSSTSGDSMLPTLHASNDYAIVDKKYKYGRYVKMGDVIVARKPNAPENWVCKRITGMPGDIIQIDPSKDSLRKLREAGGEFEEITVDTSFDHYDNYIVVPEGHVWVTGDNLSDSIDSRTYSVIPMALIAGRMTHAWYIPSLLQFWRWDFRPLENRYTKNSDY